MLSLLVAFALPSCSTEQGGPTDEEARPPPREVTKEVTRTVTVAEAPKAPKAESGARAAPVPAETPPAPMETPPAESSPDYVAVSDGALSVEVPSSWGEVKTGEDSEAGSSWSEFAGETVDYSLTAAPSLDAWGSAPGAPGVYAVASVGLAQRYANEELVAAGPNDLSGACEGGIQRAFERKPYSGFVQEWANCDGAGSGYLTLAATPRGEDCVALLTVGTAGQEGEAAGQHALDTFGVDCGAVTSYPLASADEQYAPRQDAEDSESAPTPQYEPEVPLTDQYIGDEYNLEEQCAALGKVRAGRGCVFPEDASNVPLTDGTEAPEPPGGEETGEPPLPSEPPPSSSGYPPFPGDPNGDLTCDEVGGGPYSVPPGSDRDSDGDGIACE